jgi:hypothetical protein
VSAGQGPQRDGAQAWRGDKHPDRRQNGKLSRQDRCQRGGELQEKLQAAGLFLVADRADHNEWKEEGIGQIERPEGGNEDTVKRREVAGDLRQLSRRLARLSVEADRLDVAVADERREQQKHHPEGMPDKDIAPLLADKDGKGRRRSAAIIR